MRELTPDMLAAGGATTRARLVGLGHSYRGIRRAVERGELEAVGRGWVLLPTANASIRAALAQGGVLGGASALRSYGVWVTHPAPVQIATRPHAGLGPAANGERIWGSFEVDEKRWRVTVVDALVQHCLRVERDDAIASIDSAWHRGLIGDRELDRVFDLLPTRCAGWRRLLDPTAESGLKSLLRLPCIERGWTVETQVPAPGGGRSDLLIDGWLRRGGRQRMARRSEAGCEGPATEQCDHRRRQAMAAVRLCRRRARARASARTHHPRAVARATATATRGVTGPRAEAAGPPFAQHRLLPWPLPEVRLSLCRRARRLASRQTRACPPPTRTVCSYSVVEAGVQI